MQGRKGQEVWEETHPEAGSRVAGGGGGGIKDLSPMQASTLLLRNTLVALKGEP